jgi:ring-1,2-phenylacetyl-CoA epoxidase subunit PaaE
MAAGFYRLKVDKIKRETSDAVSIRLLVPPPLKSLFEYKSGQYLTFRADINGEDVRRSYSVCESPLVDSMPSVAVKVVEGGKMSTFMNHSLREGDMIEAMPPMGNFSVVPQTNEARHIVLYGGGSGITPLNSILKTILKFEAQSKVTLLYANKNQESTIFYEELEQMSNEFGSRFNIHYAFDEAPESWTGYRGWVNETMLSDFRNRLGMPASVCHHYICGPSPMMEIIEKSLGNAGVPKDHINLEYFTATQKEKAPSEDSSSSVESKDRQVFVEVFGRREEITVGPNESILEAAQDAGLDPPYSCTVGVCTTCRARVRSGEVHMDEREGLSDAELNEGYVLTCQSHPLTDDVDLVYE